MHWTCVLCLLLLLVWLGVPVVTCEPRGYNLLRFFLPVLRTLQHGYCVVDDDGQGAPLYCVEEDDDGLPAVLRDDAREDEQGDQACVDHDVGQRAGAAVLAVQEYLVEEPDPDAQCRDDGVRVVQRHVYAHGREREACQQGVDGAGVLVVVVGPVRVLVGGPARVVEDVQGEDDDGGPVLPREGWCKGSMGRHRHRA